MKFGTCFHKQRSNLYWKLVGYKDEHAVWNLYYKKSRKKLEGLIRFRLSDLKLAGYVQYST